MSTNRSLELNREYPAQVVRSNIISRGPNDVVLVTLAILTTKQVQDQQILEPTGHTETFSILVTNEDSLRIGCSELKAAFPGVLDPTASELDVITEVLAGSLKGKVCTIRLEPQANGEINQQTGRPYYNVRINQGFEMLPKDALRAHLAKRLGLGASAASKIEA